MPIRVFGEPDSVMGLPLELVLHVLSFITSPLAAGISAENFWKVTELYDENEHRSKDMLLACPRVCRTWRRLTLPYLYSTVAMYYDPRRKHSFKTVHRYYRCLEDFVTFLLVFPQIRRHIQELRFALPEDDCVQEIDSTAFAAIRPHYCNFVLLAEVVQKLPYLRVLRLRNIHFHPDPIAIPQSGFPRLLDRLELTHTHPIPNWLDGFNSLISLFSSVTTLGLNGLHFDAGTPTRRIMPSSFTFEALELVNCSGLDEFVRAFRSELTCPTTPVDGASESLRKVTVRVSSDDLPEVVHAVCGYVIEEVEDALVGLRARGVDFVVVSNESSGFGAVGYAVVLFPRVAGVHCGRDLSE